MYPLHVVITRRRTGYKNVRCSLVLCGKVTHVRETFATSDQWLPIVSKSMGIRSVSGGNTCLFSVMGIERSLLKSASGAQQVKASKFIGALDRMSMKLQSKLGGLLSVKAKLFEELQSVGCMFCMSSLRRGHANLLCIVPILIYVPKEGSKDGVDNTPHHPVKRKEKKNYAGSENTPYIGNVIFLYQGISSSTSNKEKGIPRAEAPCVPLTKEKKRINGDQEGVGVSSTPLRLGTPACFKPIVFLTVKTLRQVLKADLHLADMDESCWSAHVSKSFSGMRNKEVFKQRLLSASKIPMQDFLGDLRYKG
eukprot:1147361-Pelagomonas_calceolata.AAC.1